MIINNRNIHRRIQLTSLTKGSDFSNARKKKKKAIRAPSNFDIQHVRIQYRMQSPNIGERKRDMLPNTDINKEVIYNK